MSVDAGGIGRGDVPHGIAATRTIACAAPGLTRERFERCYHRPRSPVVIEDAAPAWPALRQWTFDHLAARLADTAVRVHLADGAVFREAKSETRTFAAFAERTRVPGLEPGAKGVVTIPVERLGGLANDLVPWPGALPWRAHTIQVWASPPRAVTALHYDLSDAFVVQVRGRKRWVLFQPSDWRRLYPRSALERRNYHSRVDIDAPDLARFPKFAAARRHEVIVETGQALFVPAPWWHQVYSLDEENISVHYRWTSRLPRTWIEPPLVRLRLCNLYHGRHGMLRRLVVRALSYGSAR